MFGFFKKKHSPINQSSEKAEEKPDKNFEEQSQLEEQSNGTKTIVFGKKSLPPEKRNDRVEIDHWARKSGDIIEKGEVIGQLKLEHDILNSINIVSHATGLLEIHKLPEFQIWEHNFLRENEDIYSVHTKYDDLKKSQLINAWYTNVPKIITDDFSGSKEIKWANIGGQGITNTHVSTGLNDCVLLDSKDSNWKYSLMFSIEYRDNKDYIIFRYFTAGFKLQRADKISFLFDDESILEFEILSAPYKKAEIESFGHIKETAVPLKANELKTLSESTLSKWKIDFVKTGNKIFGSEISSDSKFIINKFAQEYSSLVQHEVPNYQPLTETGEMKAPNSNENDECYVYLMHDYTNDYHKIGISSNPTFREKTLQGEKPTIDMVCKKRFPSRLIARSFEQALHQAYLEKRIRGEWFELTEQDVKDLHVALK